MAELVVIEDSTVLTMINDPKFVQAIPCLANKSRLFRSDGINCSVCARKRQQRQRTEMAKIKSCLAALSQENKMALKQLLGANKVRVVFTRDSGEVVQLTF